MSRVLDNLGNSGNIADMSDNLLREMRIEAGVSQRRLATHLGLSNTALYLWEREAPTVERIERYRRAFREIANKSGAAA